MPERYKNLVFEPLSDYIAAKNFRTISEDMRSIPMGISEFAVEIQLKRETKKKLTFKTAWDGILYGCARDKRVIKEKLNLNENIKTAYLVDWDDRFLFIIELEKSLERPVAFVTVSDVVNLLENCMRMPEQTSDERND